MKIIFQFLVFFALVLTGMQINSCQTRDTGTLGYIQPKKSNQIANSYWGIQASTFDPALLKKAAEIGVKWTRLGANWNRIERTRSVYDWAETDRAFEVTLQNGINPFVTLGGANILYTKPIQNKDKGLVSIYGLNPQPPTANPKAMEAWLNFVRATVERYRDRIKYWEVWNEPNHHHYWGREPDGSDYGILLKETAKIIKEVAPQAKVLGGSMAGIDPKFTNDFLAAGTADLIDIITYHNYGALPEERIYLAGDLWNVINKFNPQIQLWQGECGYPSHSSTQGYRGISPWGLVVQAKWLLRQSFTDIYFCRATLSNYFKLVHEGGRGEMPTRDGLSAIDSVLGFPERGGSRVKSVGVNEKCLLTNPGHEPKPGYFAYQNLCAAMEDSYRPVKIETQLTIKDPGVFYGIGVEDDAFPSVPLRATFQDGKNRVLLAYWLPWHPQEIVNPAVIDLRIEAHFTNPVRLDLLSGEVSALSFNSHKVNRTVLENVPLSDYPMLIVERDAIEISSTR